MGYHKLSLRALALSCFLLAHMDLTLAVQLYKNSVPDEDKDTVKNLRAFIKNNGTKFEETGSVANRPHPPRDHKVPDDVAMECSKAFKKGYSAPQSNITENGRQECIHQWYTSIDHACVKDPYLAYVCDHYHVSPRNLLRRMYEVDPNLTRRRLDFKMELTAEQKAQRKAVAFDLYQLWLNTANFLESIFWIDEVTIWFCPHHKHVNIKVYCDAHDAEIDHVIHSPLLRTSVKKNEKIVVRAMCAVNMLLGPFFLEFTTGTTGIERRHIQPSNKAYKVSEENQIISSLSTAGHPNCLTSVDLYDQTCPPCTNPTSANAGLSAMKAPFFSNACCTKYGRRRGGHGGYYLARAFYN